MLPQVGQLQDEAAPATTTPPPPTQLTLAKANPCGGQKGAEPRLPVVHLAALQQLEGVRDDGVEDLVPDGDLRLEPLKQHAAVSKRRR